MQHQEEEKKGGEGGRAEKEEKTPILQILHYFFIQRPVAITTLENLTQVFIFVQKVF